MAVLVIHYSLGIFVGMFKKDQNDKKKKGKTVCREKMADFYQKIGKAEKTDKM